MEKENTENLLIYYKALVNLSKILKEMFNPKQNKESLIKQNEEILEIVDTLKKKDLK